MEKHHSRTSTKRAFRRIRPPIMVVVLVLLVLVTAGILMTGCTATIGGTTTSAGGAVTTAPAGQGSTVTTAGGISSTDTTEAAGNSTSGTTTPTVKADGLGSPALSVAEVLGPSVVNIKVSDTISMGGGFGQQRSQPYAAEGSGVIYRSDGMIITNNHVVTNDYTGDPVATIQVTLATGEELDATLVGQDPLTDLAVIKVNADMELPVAQFVGEMPKVGEYAIAIGSPLGYENSVTLGIVSGLSREIEGLTGTESAAYTNLIQTDAPISPGNSGGALANASGQVIGINVAYEPPSQTGAVSIGFAIPAATATNVADQLINSGKVIQGYLGVSLYQYALTPEIAQQYGLSRDSGVLIAEVVAGGPAEKAGLQQGDIVIKAGDQDVTDPTMFVAMIRDMKPGSTLDLTVDRNGQEMTFTVTIGERPSTTATTVQ